ncbi:MAG: hypothetical protein EOO15_16530 [Chitinophagaceae bacterium]|nr:MAG: hypothetical protein EOO15_16530 [Chitinophagaceae bacterium]
MRLPLLTCFLLAGLCARGQVIESFADSNFTTAPAWAGTPGAWIVNAQRQLQSAHAAPNSSFYLATPSTLADDARWSLWLRLAFSTSSANYADVWLMSRYADPDAPGNKGYFLRIGGTQDDISLYRKDPAGIVRILDGPHGSIGGSDNRLFLEVVRLQNGSFQIAHRLEGGSLVLDGQCTDATYTSTDFFCLQVRQSTASFFGKHYFDDISIVPFVADTTAPGLEWIGATSGSTVEIRFSEPVQPASLQAGNFIVNGFGAASSVQPDAFDPAVIQVQFTSLLPADTPLLLTVRQVRDNWGNELVQDTDRFFYHPPQRHDVLISELLPDPEPARALPPFEFVELRNRCLYPVYLKDWRLATENTQSAALPAYWLPPDSTVILTNVANAAAFASFGAVLGVASFPALDNDGALLRIQSGSGKTIHAVAYARSWYGDAVKDDGGWTLEMIDAANPCAGPENWRASTHPNGGTPGRTNSIAAPNPDAQAPRLLRSYALDSVTVIAEFSEPLDSLGAASAHYELRSGPAILSAHPIRPLFATVELRLGAALAAGGVYTLFADGVRDCCGTAIGVHNTVPAGRPAEATPGAVVINEILYQPKTGGAEYIELYSMNTIVNLSQLYIATRNNSGGLNAPKRLSVLPLQLYPEGYVVITSDAEDIGHRYFVAHPDALLQLAGMPSLADDGAALVLLNDRGDVLDEVRYDPGWQFALIDDPHGVALERIDAAGPSGKAANWHSASGSAGYGTPTARNSQYRNDGGEQELSVSPAVFSPDNDGFDDIAVISFSLPEPGYVANVTIFDALGRPVRNLVHNDLLGRSGRWTWDGLDDQRRSPGAGTYVLFAELFNLEGKRKVYKRAITIARKFN